MIHDVDLIVGWMHGVEATDTILEQMPRLFLHESDSKPTVRLREVNL